MNIISQRLIAIANMVSDGEVVADIGSDHAYLSIYLSKSNKAKKIYATEVNQKPFDITKNNILNFGVQHNVEAILTDGLSWFNENSINISSAIIAGMGATKILEILTKDSALIDAYILSPNTEPHYLRKWAKNKKYFIENEDLILENDKFYEIIKINKYGGKKIKSYSDILFGPILKNKDSDIVIKKWILEEQKYDKALSNMPKKSKNYKTFLKAKKTISKFINKEINNDKTK